MNLAATHSGTGDLRDLPGILSQKDQRKAFGKAKRHTIAVSILKYLMPALALVIVGMIFLPEGKVPVSLDLPVSIEGVDLSSEGLKMINPRYAGGSDKTGRYKIEAAYALQKITATHLLELHKITGLIERADNKWTKLSAIKGIYDTKTELMELQGDIHITSNQGMEARLKGAKINMREQTIVTKNPVQMKMNENVINADTMTLSIANKRVLFEGGVKVKLYKNKPMTK